MPNYEYRCNNCRCVWIVWQFITEKIYKRLGCPICKIMQNVTRLIGSGSTIIFKGRDWPGKEIKRRK
jgi:putative FmdB family regulatory protein